MPLRIVPLSLLVLTPVACLTLACASAGGGAPAAATAAARPAASSEASVPADSDGSAVPAVVRETTLDRSWRESVPAHVLAVREQMEEAYQAGLEAYQAGRFDEAKEHFDRAVDLVLTSDVDLSGQPALKKAFDEMVRNIADMDADLYTRESEPEAQENRSPLDELKDITTYLSPEEAEKERQKIQQVVGRISYDIPVTLNPRVLAYIEAFQTRLRGEFEAGLKRSGAYLPMIRKIFREAGLPEDLAYMAHQESAFKVNAYSRARAKGMWQFMSFTGRKYGLKIDLWVDERGDFEKATRAAAAYLKDLHARYGDWHLAMAAYNAGEGKIDRALARARARDYWALLRTQYIRTETKWYVPAILASILIDKSPEDYGFFVDTDPELEWDTVAVDQATDLLVIAEAAGTSLEAIRALNPELRGLVTPPNASTYSLRVPDGSKHDVLAKLETLPDDQRVSWTLHEVRPGETFSHIARRHGIPVRALLDANPRYIGKRLRRGVVLNIPLSKGTPQVALARASENPTYDQGERIVHRVRRGETLQAISARYRTTIPNLKRWNSLNGSLIRPGQRLVAYYGEKGSGPRELDANAAVSVSGGRLQYKVQAGDTLASIAVKFGVSTDDLCRWNNLDPEAVLRVGDQVLVGEAQEPPCVTCGPAGRKSTGSEATGREGLIRHRVKRGETLHRIARLYDVSVQQVRSWNRLEGSRIYAGQVLTIRGR
ncbi:MAG: LysM peptidoglycan-binding domain-containing protein [Acidobacteria bacterium]|nr:LysM peptidoglycan-binding domain-containing protein [Acidobacteriota bacterium]